MSELDRDLVPEIADSFSLPDGRPASTEFKPAYSAYIDLVPEDHVGPVLSSQMDAVREAFEPWIGEHETFSYAPGKWNIRQIVAHLIDGERLFGYRAYCFAHTDPAELPGFDQDVYAAAASAEEIPLQNLLNELDATRRANLLFLARLPHGALDRRGVANNGEITVRAILYTMAGHIRHHLRVLAERYAMPES